MENKIVKIEVIGAGCNNCKKLHELAVKAAQELGLGVEVGYSNEVQRALRMGVMQFPVLAVNDKAVLTGPVTDMEKVKKAIIGNAGETGGAGKKRCSCGGYC